MYYTCCILANQSDSSLQDLHIVGFGQSSSSPAPTCNLSPPRGCGLGRGRDCGLRNARSAGFPGGRGWRYAHIRTALGLQKCAYTSSYCSSRDEWPREIPFFRVRQRQRASAQLREETDHLRSRQWRCRKELPHCQISTGPLSRGEFVPRICATVSYSNL